MLILPSISWQQYTIWKKINRKTLNSSQQKNLAIHNKMLKSQNLYFMSILLEFQLRLTVNVHESGWKMYLLISLRVLMSVQRYSWHNLCSFIILEMKWSKTAKIICTEKIILMIFSFCFWWLKIGIKSQFRVYLGIDYQIVYCCQEIEGKITIRN